ncbi:putative Ferriportin iron efflux transporter [Hortaea werneckii]|nr:putative Ferriportin iron efflux transporter [Hortaea werneckii]KAI7094721.1 putative Ferriportin iron efflux transporter [Hortaea werneckii]KAI7226467.1 putative Ferriportin iron efflux transporter [Hortaea werneckii]KAI7314456.1 putative Ferriportin iron efflux transporter [Hortaea werneckii]KAI7397196.1 putative Ferriportin iron efflux transporter [Hortaea werneckii]
MARQDHDEQDESLLGGGDRLEQNALSDDDSQLGIETEHAGFKSIQRLLYTSHFLSTWNSRVFELGAFLFLASIYPQTLLPASVYAMTRAMFAVFLSSATGYAVDRFPRLSSDRIPNAESSTQFWLLLPLCLLAAAEKLGCVMNTIAVERDWVVAIASGSDDRLATLNAQMRRIDLFCKLAGPLAISFIDAASTKLAIIVTGSMTCASVLVEYFSIARVYHKVPELSKSKQTQSAEISPWLKGMMHTWLSGLPAYVKHQAFLPSFALALLYMTVLSFNGQMITYLIAIGVGSGAVGVLRGVAALFELSATWLGPILMKRIGAIRAGIWFLNWQLACVGVACLFFWLPETSRIILAAGTVSAVVASRLGLWGFDLSAQILVQEEVEPEMRGTFSSQEFALQNAFEMLAFLSTIVFPRPEQFKYPAAISACAVAGACVLYAVFVRSRRGHLLHLSKCMESTHRKKVRWTALGHESSDNEVELQAAAQTP